MVVEGVLGMEGRKGERAHAEGVVENPRVLERPRKTHLACRAGSMLAYCRHSTVLEERQGRKSDWKGFRKGS